MASIPMIKPQSALPPRGLQKTKLSYLPQRPPVTISFQDLSYSVPHGRKGPKLILRSVSGEFRSGQLTAILGPSGAGKSTLLNVLAGYRVNGATGSVCMNGLPRDIRMFVKYSRYIMQQDLHQPFITVLESMMLAADLKLGYELPPDKKRVVVDEIIQLLRLTGARDTVTDKLSGGERKRLSVALELLNNPPVIFLDEPTTGLDDVSSSTCVSLLKCLARGGRTVICSVHTPSARLFTEFDHVYVVAEGRCCYQGSAPGLVPFLKELNLPCPKTYNPADFVIEVSCGAYGNHLDRMVSAVDSDRCQRWRDYVDESIVIQQESDLEVENFNTGPPQEHQYKYTITPLQQFTILLKHQLMQIVRNRYYMWLRIVLNIFLSCVVGTIFFQMGNDASKALFNFGYVYACTIVMLYVPMMPILLAFPKEVQQLKREYFNKWYGLKPYYAALVISRIPPTLVFSFMYIIMTYPLTGQPLELPRISMFIGICMIVALISESMATVISSSLSSVNSIFLGPTICVPLMLLAVYGLGEKDDDLPLIWRLARACTYLRYGLEGLVLAVYEKREDLNCPEDRIFCEYKSPTYFLYLMGMSEVSYWMDMFILAMILLGMNLLGYYLLRQRLSPNYAFRAFKVIGGFVKAKMGPTQM